MTHNEIAILIALYVESNHKSHPVKLSFDRLPMGNANSIFSNLMHNGLVEKVKQIHRAPLTTALVFECNFTNKGKEYVEALSGREIMDTLFYFGNQFEVSLDSFLHI